MSLYTIGCTVSAACTLQIPPLLQMCMDFLMAELNVHTCVYVWNIGDAYGLIPVREAARRYILENFTEFSATTQFNQLTLDQITSFLQDDNLSLPSEVTIFQVSVRKDRWKGKRNIAKAYEVYLYDNPNMSAIPPHTVKRDLA